MRRNFNCCIENRQKSSKSSVKYKRLFNILNTVYKIRNVSGSLLVIGHGLLMCNFYRDIGVELLINNYIRKVLSAINLNDEDI